MALNILYEDNHMLAVDKPANLATQVSQTHADSLEAQARAYIKQKYQKPGNVFLHPVHRLDTPTSGVVLFAKTSKSLSRLQEMMRKREMKKVYVAVVEGRLKEASGTLKHRLAHDEHMAKVERDGKEAILHYRVIDSYKGAHTIVSIELETGRYHQIRAQFSFIGHPVLGDKKYGSKIPFEGDRIALHHESLSFIHPVTQKSVQIISPANF